jgi:Spy/CpxP family protein refolding chaperone
MNMIIKNYMLALAIVLTATMAYGQDQRGERPHRGKHRAESRAQEMAQQLNLTDEQQQQIKQIRSFNAREQIQRQNQIRELRAEMRTAMTQDQVDRSKINNLIDQIGALEIAGNKERAATMIAIREVLSEEQRLLFDQQTNRRGMRQRAHGHRG